MSAKRHNRVVLICAGIVALGIVWWSMTAREQGAAAQATRQPQIDADASSGIEQAIVSPRSDVTPDAVVRPTAAKPHEMQQSEESVIRSTRIIAAMQLEHFEAERSAAEAKAGSSPVAFLQFMETQLECLMRADAVAALDAGRCYEVPESVSSSVAPDLFGGAPYLMFSTGSGSNGVQTMVAVPMTQIETIKDLRSAIVEARTQAMRSYVDEFNQKGADARRAIRDAYKSTNNLEGMPRSVSDLMGYRLRWSDPECLLSLDDG